MRPFQLSDQAAVVDLWRRCGLVRPWNDPDRDLATKLAERWEELLVADEGGAVVGTAMFGFDGHRGWVYYLAVEPDRQRSGVGRSLMNECEQRLKARGCPKINLMVRGDNQAARGFYADLGYEPSDVVVLGKRLDADRSSTSQ